MRMSQMVEGKRIFEAMAGIMMDVEAIKKDQQNRQQGFRFRGIDDVYNAVHPLLAKHGVFTIPTLLEERTEERQTKNGGNLIYRILKMKYTFFTTDGSFVEAVVPGEGMDSGDKAANKGMAVAHKYALLQTLCIPTEDMIDPDSEVQEPSRKKLDSSVDQSPQKTVGVVNQHIRASLIPVGMFTVKRAWSQILELCNGDKQVAMDVFERFGADSSEKITHSIYRDAYNAAKAQCPVVGPELFEGDDIPFASSSVPA